MNVSMSPTRARLIAAMPLRARARITFQFHLPESCLHQTRITASRRGWGFEDYSMPLTYSCRGAEITSILSNLPVRLP